MLQVPTYSRDTIAEVLNATDIVELIGGVLDLKQAGGGNHLGLCPFHSEKTPSFNVSRERQTFHCFGCGKGGDAISFVREIEGLTFSEAVQKLADRAGIQLPAASPVENDRERTRTELVRVAQFAAKYFAEMLDHPLKGGRGRHYLETRALRPETVKRFGLGYAPDAGRGLLDAALTAGFKDSNLEAAGLVRRSTEGRLYDFFRNRLTFPIRDVAGKVVAFGGRDLGGESPAKYMNTPENALYKKGRVLYGLHEAREALRKEKRAILVEGYFDLLRLVDAGIENVVAPCGTALTAEQAALIRRYVPEVVVVFDGDAAGVRAALRSVAILTAAELSVRALVLPDGQDPDDFVRARGADMFREMVRDASDFVRFYAQSEPARLASIEGRTEVARELFTILLNVNDELRRDEYLKKMAEELRLNEWAVRTEFQKQASRQEARRTRAVSEAPKAIPFTRDDVHFIAALLGSEPLRETARKELEALDALPAPLGAVLEEVFAGGGPGTTGRFEDESAAQLYAAACVTTPPDNEKCEELVTKRVARLVRDALRTETTRLLEEIQEAERGQDLDRLKELLLRKVSIDRRIQEVGAA